MLVGAEAYIRTKSDEHAITLGYYFDDGKADTALAWIGTNFAVKLYEWQRLILWLYFGWRNPQGGYRFKKISVWIPKKNGKSWLISVLAAYKTFELKNARIYSVAVNSNQAKIVLDGSISLMMNSPTVRKFVDNGKIRCYSTPGRKEIHNDMTGTQYKALTDRIDANDGLIGNVLIIDEIHRMKNEVIDVSRGMLKKNPTALEVIISTAGNGDKTHRSWQFYQDAKAVLTGEVIDVHTLPVIYEAPAHLSLAQIYDLEVIKQCNPVLLEDEEKAKLAEIELAESLRIRNDGWHRRFILNQWLSQDGDEYIDADTYDQCEAEAPAESILKESLLCVGFDKGGTWDFTAASYLWLLANGQVFERHFTFAVADRLAEMGENDDMDYQRFIDAGELIVIPADAVAAEWVAEWLIASLTGYKVHSIAADPTLASYETEKLASKDFDVFKVQQSNNRLLTPVIEDYAERIRQKRITHEANALYAWQLSNARKATSSKDTCKIVKRGSNTLGKGGRGHIDSVDSVLMAMAVLRTKEIEQKTYGDCGAVVGYAKD